MESLSNAYIFNDKMETLSNASVLDTLISCEPKCFIVSMHIKRDTTGGVVLSKTTGVDNALCVIRA